MRLAIFIMGIFLESMAIMFIMIPIYMPIVYQMGFEPIWFAGFIMMNIEVACSRGTSGYGSSRNRHIVAGYDVIMSI
jgi:TRAP-type mannitol/chloroaromatic compound transport system permease large subunit